MKKGCGVSVIVRREVAGDEGGIRAVHLASFPTSAEAVLVDALRAGKRLTVSLVAIEMEDGARGDWAGRMRSAPASNDHRVDGVSQADDDRAGSPVGGVPAASAARAGSDVIGHVAFSPVSVDGSGGGVGLAPVAVLPAYRRRGVAARLVRDGLAACAAMGVRFVVVLGEPAYYGRFGFVPARRWGLHDEYGGGDAFQALELQAGSLSQLALREGSLSTLELQAGSVSHADADRCRLVRYAPEFGALPT